MCLLEYWVMLLKMAIAAVLIFFVSGRLIGPNVNFIKRVLSVVISVCFTTFVYWYSYLRYTDYNSGSVFEQMMEVSTLLWFGSMLLISMLLYLFFELFDPTGLGSKGERVTGHKNLVLRARSSWRHQKRLRQVLQIAMKNGVPQTIKFARQRENERILAVALRETLEECGGIFVKFGQVLSTRTDLFSHVFIEELGKLQQNAKPLEIQQVEDILNKMPYDAAEVFTHFNKVPLASASIGQVHLARLRINGLQVVVKLRRPEVHTVMRDDLDILVDFATLLSKKSTWAENLGFKGLAIGFAEGLLEEIRFDIEARNMIQVTNTLAKSKYEVKIPHVYTEYSDERVLVMDFAHGVSVAKAQNDILRLGVEPKSFARTVLYSFVEQMLYSGIFHADPHPGNIYIDSDDGKPILLDFGAVGRLGAPQQEGLRLLLMGIHQRDATTVYDGVVLLVENADVAERTKMEQAFSQILLKISFVDRIQTDDLIFSVFNVVKDFGLAFYPSVGLALRSIVTLDGTLRMVDPDFDIFGEAKEFSTGFLQGFLLKPFKEPREMKEKLEEELSMLLPTLRKLPRRFDQLIQRVESGKIILHHDIFSDKHNSRFITHLFSRLVLLMSGITFGVISVALLAITQFMHTSYATYLNTAAYLGLFLCAVLLVRLSIQAIREMKQND